MSLSKNIISKNLKRYNINKRKYYIMKINTIIYNKKSHYVSKFKELLFLNDLNEFLIQYYPSILLKIFVSKFLYYKTIKNLFPCLIDRIIIKIMNKNQKEKKTIYKLNFDKQQDENNKLIFSYILNTIITNSTIKEFSNIDFLNTQTTIDNLHVNDDITMSLDLHINKNYDYNNIEKRNNFVCEKNINDNTILNIINLLNGKQKISKNKNIRQNLIGKRNIDFSKIKYLNTKIKPKNLLKTKNLINNHSDLSYKVINNKKNTNKTLSFKPLKKNRTFSNFKKNENITTKNNNSKSKLYDFNLSEYLSREKKINKPSSKCQTQSFSTYFHNKGNTDSKILNKSKKMIKDSSKITLKKIENNIFWKPKKIIKSKNNTLNYQTENIFSLLTPKRSQKINKKRNDFKQNSFCNFTFDFNSEKKKSNSVYHSLINSSEKKNISKGKKFLISLNKAKKINTKLNNTLKINKKK